MLNIFKFILDYVRRFETIQPQLSKNLQGFKVNV
jgi:hypothetical protein